MFDAFVIDDYTPAARAMAVLLEQICPSNWSVGFTTSGPDAAAEGLSVLIGQPRLRLVVIDYLLPRFDGQDIIEMALRARPSLRGRIIVSSGWGFPEDIQQRLFEELGCLRLDKPTDSELLKEHVEKIVAIPV